MNEDDFMKQFDKYVEEESPKFNENLNIVVVGSVSSGKSSLLNAILECDPENPIFKVGAESGVTTKVKAHRLAKDVLIIDSPGLDDVRKENSEETKSFLDSIDVGIFVLTGSLDAKQKLNFDDLKKNSKEVFVVLNKIDAWDELEESELEKVMAQWCKGLGINEIFPVCTKGYDPKRRKGVPMDVRGVDDLQSALFDYLKNEGKDLILKKHLANKEKYAVGIIATALVAVAGFSFVPGSAAYITGAQVVAITSLHYLYKGEVMSKVSALTLMPTFIGQNIGKSLFLIAKSFLPPTGVVDAAAAAIAVSLTAGMLLSLKYVFENEKDLKDKESLKAIFKNFSFITPHLKGMSPLDFTNKDKIFELLMRIMKNSKPIP